MLLKLPPKLLTLVFSKLYLHDLSSVYCSCTALSRQPIISACVATYYFLKPTVLKRLLQKSTLRCLQIDLRRGSFGLTQVCALPCYTQDAKHHHACSIASFTGKCNCPCSTRWVAAPDARPYILPDGWGLRRRPGSSTSHVHLPPLA